MSYPKIYATITESGLRDNNRSFWLRAVDGTGREYSLDTRWRNGGRTPTDSLKPGVRIKIYQVPGRGHYKFRRVGR